MKNDSVKKKGTFNRKMLQTSIFLSVFIFSIKTNAQSIGYYPWNGLISVSTNPSKNVWCDFRLQTNTLFGSLSTEILPMVNIKRTSLAQFYVGGGVRFNFVGVIANQTKNIVEGYSLNFGSRISPFKSAPNFAIVLELVPYVARKFDSGILKSNFGLIYTFGKKN